nr:hypothetical protein [Deltaproteobacteria bacterium]
MTRKRDALLARLPALPSASEPQLAALAALHPPEPTTAGGRSVAALIEAVIAEPARRELRDVLR